MNIKQMAAQAREHWKVTNPAIYQQMAEDNALVACSEAAAKLTMREMEALKLIGMSERSLAGEPSFVHIQDSGTDREVLSAGQG